MSLADDFIALVTWGDGTQDEGGVTGSAGSFTVTDNHVYMQAGHYPILVTIQDIQDGSVATASGSADVNPAPLELTAGFREGLLVGQTTAPLLAVLTDTNPDVSVSSVNLSIDWGDNSGISSGELVPEGDGVFNVLGTHAYANRGVYTVTIRVDDPDGNPTTAQSTMVAGDLYVGLPATLTVATFADADVDASASNFTAMITWGDGASALGIVTQSNGSFVVQGQHTYAVDSFDEPQGVYAVTVTITHPGGSPLTAASTVGVVRPPVTLYTANPNSAAGEPLTNTPLALFTAPAPADLASEYSADVSWGDQSTDSDTVQRLSPGFFVVLGNHTYATASPFAIQVEVLQGWAAQKPAAAGKEDKPGAADKADFLSKAEWVQQANGKIAGYKTQLPKNPLPLQIAIARNRYITAAYASLYLEDKRRFPWLGLAAFASDEVGDAIRFLEGESKNPSTDAKLASALKQTALLLGPGNIAVYEDVYWQFLAYKAKGLKQMQWLKDRGELSAEQLDVWSTIAKDGPIDRADRIWDGNLKMFYIEQHDILQPKVFNKLPTLLGIPIGMVMAKQATVPLFPGATPFKSRTRKDLANFDQRWSWIKDRLWIEWTIYSVDPDNWPKLRVKMQTLAKPNR